MNQNQNDKTREGADALCRLYVWGTYAPTELLTSLRNNDTPLTKELLTELYEVFLEGTQMTLGDDAEPCLQEFGQWLSGTGDFEGQAPAEVIW